MERIKEALRAHFKAGVNLTISGYARAASITRETVREYLPKIGIPGREDRLTKDELGAEPDPAASIPDPSPASSSPGAPAGTPPATPAAGPASPGTHMIPVNPVDLSITRKDLLELRAHVDRVLTTIQTMPPATAQAVTEAIGQVVGESGRSPAAMAEALARQRVSSEYSENVVGVASDLLKYDTQAGEAARRVWLNGGHNGEFASPRELVETCYQFWLRNRDLVSHLMEENYKLQEYCEAASQDLSEENRRRVSADQVWLFVLAAKLNGVDLPLPLIQQYLRAARNAASVWSPPSDASIDTAQPAD